MVFSIEGLRHGKNVFSMIERLRYKNIRLNADIFMQKIEEGFECKAFERRFDGRRYPRLHLIIGIHREDNSRNFFDLHLDYSPFKGGRLYHRSAQNNKGLDEEKKIIIDRLR